MTMRSDSHVDFCAESPSVEATLVEWDRSGVCEGRSDRVRNGTGHVKRSDFQEIGLLVHFQPWGEGAVSRCGRWRWTEHRMGGKRERERDRYTGGWIRDWMK